MRRTFRGAFLAIEALILAAVALFAWGVLGSAKKATLEEYQRRLRTEIRAVDVLLRGFLERAARPLETYARVRGRAPDTSYLSDLDYLYEVDYRFRITRILKASGPEKAFPGYDLGSGALGAFLSTLGTTGDPGLSLSPVIRAFENEEPCVYAALRSEGAILLGRVSMASVFADLDGVARYSSTTIGIATKDGFVLAATGSGFPVDSLPGSGASRLEGAGGPYVYAREGSASLAGDIAIIAPLAVADWFMRPLGWVLPVLVAGVALLVGLGVVVVESRFLLPLGRFVDALGRWSIEAADPAPPADFLVYKEAGDLYGAFARKAAEIREAVEVVRSRDAEITRLNEGLELRVRDRTEQLTIANDELVRANRKLEDALSELSGTRDRLLTSEKMAALGRVTAGIAHELNTPLGAVRSAAEWLESEMAGMAALLAGLASSMEADEAELFRRLAALGAEAAWPGRAELSARRARSLALAEGLERRGIPRGEAAEIADDLAEIGVGTLSEEDERILARAPGSGAAIARGAYLLSAAQRSARVCRMAVDKAVLTVGALRNWSHVDGSELAPVEIASALDMVLALYYNQIKRGIEVVKDYRDRGDVAGSRDQLDQVWVNLINNALYAMGESGRLELSIARDADGFVSVGVADSGPGIPPDLAPRVFTPFFSTKPQGQGMGLGLDLCRRIVERHGGSISFESRPGRTVFKVRLPAVRHSLEPREGL